MERSKPPTCQSWKEVHECNFPSWTWDEMARLDTAGLPRAKVQTPVAHLHSNLHRHNQRLKISSAFSSSARVAPLKDKSCGSGGGQAHGLENREVHGQCPWSHPSGPHGVPPRRLHMTVQRATIAFLQSLFWPRCLTPHFPV